MKSKVLGALAILVSLAFTGSVSAQDLGCRHNGEDPSRREELDRSRRVPLGAPASNAVVPLLIHIVEADADVK